MKKHEHSGQARKSFSDPAALLIKAGLSKGDTVLLDIGAGTGYLALAAAEIMGSGSTVYALESHEASVRIIDSELAEKGISNVVAIKADAVIGIPLPKDSVDICLLSNVLHGFAANGEMDAVLKNINSVIRDDGKLIIIDFKKVEMPFGPPLDIRLTADEIENRVAPYGYAVEGGFEAGQSHYGIVFNKICLQDKFC